jgi:hypothetical protein
MIYADDSWQLNPNMVDYESWSSAGFAAIKTNQRVTGFIAPNGDTKIGNLSSIPASKQL